MLLINDLRRHQEAVAGAIGESLARVAQSGWFVLGAEGEAFEAAFAAYCGTPHAIGVANGTDALELALKALGVKAGDRVATVANAGFYACTALNAIGAAPLFVDVDAESQLMDLDALETALGQHPVAAIVVTHLYGRLHDMDRLAALSRRFATPLLEDCAQAHGAARDGRRAGSFGDAAAFSFYPTKNLGALGDGGAVVTRRADVDEAVRALRQYGWSGKYEVSRAGGRNSRLDELQAAVLRAKLPRLDGWNARRREISARYSQGISHPEVRTPPVSGEDDVAHLYVVRTARRDALRAHLKSAGVAADVHYPIPDHRQPCWAGRLDVRLPVTEELAGEVLTLPCFPELTHAEVDQVIAAVNAW